MGSKDRGPYEGACVRPSWMYKILGHAWLSPSHPSPSGPRIAEATNERSMWSANHGPYDSDTTISAPKKMGNKNPAP